MGTSLTGLTPATTYDALIKVTDNGSLSATAKYLSDGLGNDSVLALSTTAVGIGTANPLANLDISGGTIIIGQNKIDGSTDNLKIASDFNSVSGSSSIEFLIDNSERVRITNAGNVGIGTTSPAYKLDVSTASGETYIRVDSAANQDGGFRISEGGTNKWLLYNVSASDALSIYDNTATAERLRIASNGNLTIKGPTASNGGVLNLENTTTAVNGSDWGSVNFISNDSSTSASGIRASIVGTSTSFNGDGNIVFSTAPSNGVNTERMRILATGGLTFNGDTAAANALDDYEEGTFTATITGGTFSSLNTGVYTKIGRQVYWYLSPTATAITGNLVISGLPFTNANRSASVFATVPPAGVTYLPAFHNSSSASCDVNVSGTYSGGAVSTYFSGVYSV